MKRYRSSAYILLLSVLLAHLSLFPVSLTAQNLDLSFYTPPSDTDPYPLMEQTQIKNIILMIGDGMSLTPIVAARIRALGADGTLHIQRMPVTGFLNTHAADKLITDSASSATSLSSGYKTNNGMIGMLPDGTKVYTILEAARDKGMATGLVATSTITHATPASFAAHVRARSNQAAIAVDFIANRVNVILGGGREFFMPQTDHESRRLDDRNIVEEAISAGYEFVQTKAELENSNGSYVLGLFENGPLTTNAPEPTIEEMTIKAIEILSRNDNGFFLMVEGSQIDWGEHDNDGDYAIRQMLMFDLAIKRAVEFAENNGETLLVITADHETGGMTINGGELTGENLELKWTTGSHTGISVPVFAFGPHAERFMGWKDQTDIPKIFAELLNINDFPRILPR